MPDHSMLKQLCSNLASFIICSTLLSGCSDSINNKQINETQSTHKPEVSEQLEQSTSEETISPASAFFIALVDEHFSELLKESKNLNTNLIAFTKKPSSEGLKKAIMTLEKTHSIFVSGYFLDTCCFIYTHNPIKDENDLSSIAIKTRLDQQPLLPGYLDVVDGYPYSGMIYSDIPIARKNMEEEFQLGDPAYVTLGFHALELILKGSNLKRTASDFAPLTSTNDTSTAPAELRRTLYAILLASEIENDISLLKQTWEAKLKNQLQHNTIAQANKFFLALHLKVEKELLGMPSKQVITEGNHLKPDEHFNLESLSLKQSLLEKLASLKNIENGS